MSDDGLVNRAGISCKLSLDDAGSHLAIWPTSCVGCASDRLMILQSYAFLTAVLPEVTLGSCSQPSPILRQRFVALPACELPTHLRLLLLSTVLSILDE